MRVKKQMTTMELGIHDVLTDIADENDTASFWRVLFSNERKVDDNGRADTATFWRVLFSNEWKADDSGRVGGSWGSQTTTLLRFDRDFLEELKKEE